MASEVFACELGLAKLLHCVSASQPKNFIFCTVSHFFACLLMAARLTPCVGVMIITPILGLGGSYAKRSERNYRVPGSHYAQRERSGVGHNGPAIKQVAEGNLPEGR
ncbi:MAG: hypothetical protein LC101_02070, partial [Flavobacteriales bacterium]|nr:hypothetical protein [Flavobacteriales bacterium]